MSYYRVCPICGANLDPGERCDCQDEEVRDEREGKVDAGATPSPLGKVAVR